MRKVICLAAGIFLFLVLLFAPLEASGIPATVKYTCAVTALMIVWWITEPVPLAATALLPFVLLPLLGVLKIRDVAAAYADPIIFLFFGGFVIAASMERWGLHRRIALGIIRLVGTSPGRLVLGFMLATALLSMWISNTACAMMMMPMAIAIIATLGGRTGHAETAGPGSRFAACLVLGVAYAATIGGIGTPIGTPPNGIFIAQVRTLFPSAPPIDFFTWLKFGVPFAGIFLILAWFWLTHVVFRDMPPTIPGAERIIRQETEALGPLTRGERWTLIVFVLIALAWIFTDTKNIGSFTVPGLDTLLPGITDSAVAVTGALLLFVLPVDVRKGVFTMDWETAVRIPWGILLIFGGGLALSAAFTGSGLAGMVIRSLGFLAGYPPVLVLVVFGIVFLAIGELISNTANAAIMIPLMAAAGVAVGINPLMLMLLSSLIAALGFMLPVATPPNAIAYGTGYVRTGEMIRTGFVLNIIGLVLILICMATLIPWAFGITPQIPSWANLP